MVQALTVSFQTRVNNQLRSSPQLSPWKIESPEKKHVCNSRVLLFQGLILSVFGRLVMIWWGHPLPSRHVHPPKVQFGGGLCPNQLVLTQDVVERPVGVNIAMDFGISLKTREKRVREVDREIKAKELEQLIDSEWYSENLWGPEVFVTMN